MVCLVYHHVPQLQERGCSTRGEACARGRFDCRKESRDDPGGTADDVRCLVLSTLNDLPEVGKLRVSEQRHTAKETKEQMIDWLEEQCRLVDEWQSQTLAICQCSLVRHQLDTYECNTPFWSVTDTMEYPKVSLINEPSDYFSAGDYLARFPKNTVQLADNSQVSFLS